MMLRSLFAFFLLSFLITACKENNKYKKQEEQLKRWEQNLREREQQLSLKEADYKSLMMMRDSLLARKDSMVAQVWPAFVNGQWKSTILCKESNCNNYVIGDQRSEMWEFNADSAGMFTRVLNNTKLVRVYSGRFDANKILLHFTDSTLKKKVDMQVVLDQIDKDMIKGTEVIVGENNCTAKFSVELARAAKK
jgi:hypothetical protein